VLFKIKMNVLSATSADFSRFLHKSAVKVTSLSALFHLRRNFKVIQGLLIFKDETYTFVGFNSSNLKLTSPITDLDAMRF
jgi:hypothetical protein